MTNVRGRIIKAVLWSVLGGAIAAGFPLPKSAQAANCSYAAYWIPSCGCIPGGITRCAYIRGECVNVQSCDIRPLPPRLPGF